MPSPFPGMDPYIEDPYFWSDFHGNFMGAIRAALNAVLPGRYIASTERHVWVRQVDNQTARSLGDLDVQVADKGRAAQGATAVATAPAPPALAPRLILLPLVREQGSRFVRIMDRRYRRVVTAVEVLSPSHKVSGEDGDVYRLKRSEYLGGRVNLVEIDFLRTGHRPSIGDPPPDPSDYYVLVSRATEFPETAFWPLFVRDPLPTLAVPLDPDVSDVPLDLRACLDRAYEEGRYASDIDYSQPPIPALNEADAAWAKALLAGRP
jgi:hypothetical protein